MELEENSQLSVLSARLSARVPDVSQAEELDIPILQGIEDFFAALDRPEVEKLKRLVPSTFLVPVLEMLKVGGMTQSMFGLALADARAKADSLKARPFEKSPALDEKDLSDPKKGGIDWHKHVTNKEPIEGINDVRFLIVSAVRKGWIDRRIQPTLPHPSQLRPHFDLPRPENLDESTAQWKAFESSSIAAELLERLDALEACYMLREMKMKGSLENSDISFANVEHFALVETRMRSQVENGLKASYGQRRFRSRQNLIKHNRDPNMFWSDPQFGVSKKATYIAPKS